MPDCICPPCRRTGKPFVTVEVSNGKIVQIRGERNSDPTKEVKKFVDLWSRKVLPMALQTA